VTSPRCSASRRRKRVGTLGLVGEADSDLIVNRDGRGWTWQTAALRQKYFDAIPRRMAAPVTATGEE
jgi:hypothetical protein